MKKQKSQPTKLNLACGNEKKDGYLNVDIYKSSACDFVFDLRKDWPWKDNSIEDVYCSHFIEHLEADERIHFFNELYRVLKKDAKALIIVPHWASVRAYGDLSHKWPPVSEMFFYYLSKEWRTQNAPYLKLICNFNATWGYSISPAYQSKNQEVVQFGLTHYREVAQDIIATLTKI